MPAGSARRWIRFSGLTDANGRQLAVNDDHEDKSSGLLTHHADSLIATTLPADGAYYLRLADVQQKGGAAYAYRLRISEPRPDFVLLVTPPSISVRAGTSVPIVVHVVRRDGFAGEIAIKLKNAPKGFALSGGRVPAGQDETRLTLTAPRRPPEEPVALHFEGRATIGGRVIVRQASSRGRHDAGVHLPSSGSRAEPDGGGDRPRAVSPAVEALDKIPVKLAAGGTASVRFSMPRGPQLEKVRLTLHDAPAGISIQKVSLAQTARPIMFRADAETMKPGQKGNLIVDASVERTVNPKNGKSQGTKENCAAWQPARHTL